MDWQTQRVEWEALGMDSGRSQAADLGRLALRCKGDGELASSILRMRGSAVV